MSKQKQQSITLTMAQIKELAEFTGMKIEGDNLTEDEAETEFVIATCPPQGIKEDDGSIVHYKYVAWIEEYPEEGVFPLGEKIPV